MKPFVYGSGIIKRHNENGSAPITYQGSIIVRLAGGGCHGQIPGTHLGTKDYASFDDLRASARAGELKFA